MANEDLTIPPAFTSFDHGLKETIERYATGVVAS